MKPLILVVEDNLDLLYNLNLLLESNNYKPVTAKNGKEALKILSNLKEIPDIIISDIMMPEMDGYEAMRQIRKQKRFADLPILALTAKAMSGDKEKCLEAGASYYLAKPVVIDRVISMLRVWLYK